MKKTHILALLAVLLLAQPAFCTWTQFQKNEKHTGEECDVSINLPLCIKWRILMPGVNKRGPIGLVDGDGFLYINGASAISKINIETGAVAWIKYYNSTMAPGVLYNNTVIFPYQYGFRCFDKATGNLLWDKTVTGAAGDLRYSSPGSWTLDSYPSLKDGKIYIGSSKGEIIVTDATTGNTLNVFPVSAATKGILNSPAIDDDGTIYVGSADGYVYAVNGSTGAIKWTYNTASAMWSSASIDSSGIYFGLASARIIKLNKATGAEIWNKLTGSFVHGSGALYDGHFFIGSDDRYIYKFDKDTGTMKWKIQVEDNLAIMSCVIICGKLFIAGCINKVVMIDTSTGNYMHACHSTESNFSNLTYWNKNLIFQSDDDYLYNLSECPVNCAPCSCDARLTHTKTPVCTPTVTPTLTSTVTSADTYTATKTATPTLTLTATATRTGTPTRTPTFTATGTKIPTQTPTATEDPCKDAAAPVFTVKMVFNPENTDNIIFEITSTEELLAPPTAVICPHGANTISAGSLSKQCVKSCSTWTAEPVPDKPGEYRVLYPKSTGFGDIDSVTIKGTSKCGIFGISDGQFDKSVISGLDVKIFKNVIKPDEGERSIIRYKVYENDRVTIKIYNRNGQLVMTFLDNVVKAAGEYEVIWDGKNSAGKTVASGIYNAVVKTAYYEVTEKISVLR